MADGNGKIEGWFVVQQMGHRNLIGEVKQIQMGETALLRVDVPGYSEEVEVWKDDGDTVVERRTFEPRFEIINPASIYALAPVTKEKAMELLVSRGTTPFWIEPKLIEPVKGKMRELPQIPF